MQGKVARRSGRPGFRLVCGRARADLRDESRLGLGGSGPFREEPRPGLLSEPGPVRDESRPDLNEPKFGLGRGPGRLGLGAGWVGRADPGAGPGRSGGCGNCPGGPAIRATGRRCSPGRPAHRGMRSFPTARGLGNGRLRWNPRTSWTQRFRRPQRPYPRRRPHPQRPPYPPPACPPPACPPPACPPPACPPPACPPPAKPQSACPPSAHPQQASYPRQPSRSWPPQPLRRPHRRGLGPTRVFRPLFRPLFRRPRPVLLRPEHAAHRGRGRPR